MKRKKVNQKIKPFSAEFDCPRCKKKFRPKSIAELYVCPKCGAFMPRYEGKSYC